MSVERAENSSSVRGRGSWTPSASRYTSTRRMLCTLTSGALRRGAGQLSMTRFPRCTPERSSVRCGTASTGGSGGRRFPHAASVKAKGKRQKAKMKNENASRRARISLLPFAFISEDVAAEGLIFDDVGERARDVFGVNQLPLLFEVWAEEAYLVEDFLHDRVEAARADVLGLLVDADREARDRIHGVLREVQLYAFGFQKRLVLFDQGVLRLSQDALEVFEGEREELPGQTVR